MALIDKASLLMVPSTYEAGKLYNVLPSGNRAPDSTDQNSGYDQTRADFDFDRGTDHAATRIGSDGGNEEDVGSATNPIQREIPVVAAYILIFRMVPLLQYENLI